MKRLISLYLFIAISTIVFSQDKKFLTLGVNSASSYDVGFYNNFIIGANISMGIHLNKISLYNGASYLFNPDVTEFTIPILVSYNINKYINIFSGGVIGFYSYTVWKNDYLGDYPFDIKQKRPVFLTVGAKFNIVKGLHLETAIKYMPLDLYDGYSNSNKLHLPIEFRVGYDFTLVRKKDKNKTKVEKTTKPQTMPKNTAQDYSVYTDARLKELLKTALAKEDYAQAEKIQQELDKRGVGNNIDNQSKAELEQMLKKAVSEERYEDADAIQQKLNKLDTLNPYTNKSKTELEQMLKEALQKEDYEKAAEIQEELDKR